MSIFVVALAAAPLVSAAPVIDDTPTRVQTPLKVGMRPVGTLRPKAVGEVSASRWTIDGATLDREHYDWRAIREYLPPLGIPRMRQQAGWARCEKDPGKYDGRTVYSVPGYDSPTFITDRSVLTLDESWEARWLREREESD